MIEQRLKFRPAAPLERRHGAQRAEVVDGLDGRGPVRQDDDAVREADGLGNIVWIGAGTESIIAMTIAISIFVTILNMHVGFLSTDREKIRLMQTLGATRHQILWRLVIPANYATLFNTLRVNVGLSWVGVIMGEFLVSKAGLGYLIVYGSQVFNMDLVMATVLVLAVAAVVMYQLVLWLEKFFKNRLGVTQ